MALDNKQIMTYESLLKVLDYVDERDSMQAVFWNDDVAEIKRVTDRSEETAMNVNGITALVEDVTYTFFGMIPHVTDSSTGRPVFEGYVTAKYINDTGAEVSTQRNIRVEYNGTAYEVVSVKDFAGEVEETANAVSKTTPMSDIRDAIASGKTTFMGLEGFECEIDGVKYRLGGSVPHTNFDEGYPQFRGRGYATTLDYSASMPVDVAVVFVGAGTVGAHYEATATIPTFVETSSAVTKQSTPTEVTDLVASSKLVLMNLSGMSYADTDGATYALSGAIPWNGNDGGHKFSGRALRIPAAGTIPTAKAGGVRVTVQWDETATSTNKWVVKEFIKEDSAVVFVDENNTYVEVAEYLDNGMTPIVRVEGYEVDYGAYKKTYSGHLEFYQIEDSTPEKARVEFRGILAENGSGEMYRASAMYEVNYGYRLNIDPNNDKVPFDALKHVRINIREFTDGSYECHISDRDPSLPAPTLQDVWSRLEGSENNHTVWIYYTKDGEPNECIFQYTGKERYTKDDHTFVVQSGIDGSHVLKLTQEDDHGNVSYNLETAEVGGKATATVKFVLNASGDAYVIDMDSELKNLVEIAEAVDAGLLVQAYVQDEPDLYYLHRCDTYGSTVECQFVSSAPSKDGEGNVFPRYKYVDFIGDNKWQKADKDISGDVVFSYINIEAKNGYPNFEIKKNTYYQNLGDPDWDNIEKFYSLLYDGEGIPHAYVRLDYKKDGKTYQTTFKCVRKDSNDNIELVFEYDGGNVIVHLEDEGNEVYLEPFGTKTRPIDVHISDSDGDVIIKLTDKVMDGIYGEGSWTLSDFMESMLRHYQGSEFEPLTPNKYLGDKYIPMVSLYLNTSVAPYDDPDLAEIRNTTQTFVFDGSKVDEYYASPSYELVFTNDWGALYFKFNNNTGGVDIIIKKLGGVKYKTYRFYSVVKDAGVDPQAISDIMLAHQGLETGATSIKPDVEEMYQDLLAGKRVSAIIFNDETGYYNTEIHTIPVIEDDNQIVFVGGGNIHVPDYFLTSQPYGTFKVEIDTTTGEYIGQEYIPALDGVINSETPVDFAERGSVYQLSEEKAWIVDAGGEHIGTIQLNGCIPWSDYENDFRGVAFDEDDNARDVCVYWDTDENGWVAIVSSLVDVIDEIITDATDPDFTKPVSSKAVTEYTFGKVNDAEHPLAPEDKTTYGKMQIDALLEAINGVTMKVVDAEPTPATSDANTIYIYNGTMYLCYKVGDNKIITPIGGTAPDLTQYWKKTEGTVVSSDERTKLQQDYTKAQIDTELAKKLNKNDAYVVKAELDSAKRLKLTDSAGTVVTQNNFIEKVEKNTNKLKLTDNAGGVVTQEDFLMKVEEVATGYKFTRSDNTTSTFLKITDAEWEAITDYIDEKIDELV